MYGIKWHIDVFAWNRNNLFSKYLSRGNWVNDWKFFVWVSNQHKMYFLNNYISEEKIKLTILIL